MVKFNHVIFMALVLILAGCAGPQACTTADCFISDANDCKAVSVELTEDIGVIQYTTTEDCTFTKQIVSLDESESQEMKNLLEGKRLTCSYEVGNFDERWVKSLIDGIETCDGELKDIIGQLLIFT